MPLYSSKMKNTMNSRQWLAAVALLANINSVSAQDISLDGQWQFFYAKDTETADSLVNAGFYATDFKCDGFHSIPVPSCWAILGYEEPTYRTFDGDKGSEGLYVTHFSIPKEWKGRRLQLNFGGVWASAEIWLNGQWIGRHDSGYTSFAYSVSKEAVAGGDNVLAVRVRQTYKGYKCDTYDDWSLGGIYRSVSLSSTPSKLWIDNVRTRTTLSTVSSVSRSGGSTESVPNDRTTESYIANLDVTVMVGDSHSGTLPGNYRSPGTPYIMRISLYDAEGNTVATWRQNIEAHISTFRAMQTRLSVAHPHLWNAEQPYLYTLSTEIEQEGKVVHKLSKKVGLREISTAGGVLRINGVAVKLRGVNRHDEWPDVGRATTREHWLKDLTMMKEANINYVRACHYQHAKGFIEMCDSIGMYVGAEVSLGGAGGMMTDPGFFPSMSLRVGETVLRDIDNPSIIYWSVGNEDSFTTMYYQAAKMVKALDGTRPVLYPWNADSTLPADIDILAPHYWTAHEYDSLATVSKRPIITTEYVHAYGTERFGGLEDCWKALTEHAAGAGGAVWMWADQGIKTPVRIDPNKFQNKINDDYLRVSSAGWDGITDSYRNPTRDYWEVKAVYAPVKVEKTIVASQKEIASVALHNNYDFTPLDNFRQQWTLMVDGKTVDSGIATVTAAPHEEGTLTVPTKRIGRLLDGQTAYVRIVTLDSHGHDVATNTVRLSMPTRQQSKQSKVSVSENGDEISVTTSGKQYVFSRRTGSLNRVKVKGETVVEDLRPTVWHKLDEGEAIIKNRQMAKGASLEAFTAKVERMEIRQDGDSCAIVSRVLYNVNDSNSIVADYTFSVLTTGQLNLDYRLNVDVQTTMLPLVGVSVKTAKEASLGNWFGQGAADAYPNKRAYPLLGLYDASNAYGCKAMEWVEVKRKGSVLRLSSEGYLVRDSGNGALLRLAPYVLGRSEKGRLKDERYILSSKGNYNGHLSIN